MSWNDYEYTEIIVLKDNGHHTKHVSQFYSTAGDGKDRGAEMWKIKEEKK